MMPAGIMACPFSSPSGTVADEARGHYGRGGGGPRAEPERLRVPVLRLRRPVAVDPAGDDDADIGVARRVRGGGRPPPAAAARGAGLPVHVLRPGPHHRDLPGR